MNDFRLGFFADKAFSVAVAPFSPETYFTAQSPLWPSSFGSLRKGACTAEQPDDITSDMPNSLGAVSHA
jgi:hypothetical protein